MGLRVEIEKIIMVIIIEELLTDTNGRRVLVVKKTNSKSGLAKEIQQFCKHLKKENFY